jgi:hypothetical protein
MGSAFQMNTCLKSVWGRCTLLLLGTGYIHWAYFRYLGLDRTVFSSNAVYVAIFISALAVTCQSWDSNDFWGQASRVKKFSYSIVMMVVLTLLLTPFEDLQTFDIARSFPLASDQSWYTHMTVQLIQGQFTSSDYYYGLGFPLLSRLVYELTRFDPLLVASIFCGVVTSFSLGLFIETLAGSFFIGTASMLFLAASHFLQFEVRTVWSSSMSLAIFSVALALLCKRRLSRAGIIWLGFAAGLIFSTRYVDFILLVPACVTGWFFLLRQSRRVPTHLQNMVTKNWDVWLSISLFVALILLVLLSHWYYFGSPLKTPYSLHGRPLGGSDQDAVTFTQNIGYPFLLNLYGTLIDSVSSVHDWKYSDSALLAPVFARQLMFVIGLIGLPHFYKECCNRVGTPICLSLLAGMLGYLIVYGHHPGSGPGCLAFGSHHYYQIITAILIPSAFLWMRGVLQGCTQAQWKIIFGWSIACLLTALTCSLVAWNVSPKNATLVIGPSQLAAGSTAHLTVTFANYRGRETPLSVIQFFQPNGELKYVKSDGNWDIIKITDLKAGPNDQNFWQWKADFPITDAIATGSKWQFKLGWSAYVPVVIQPLSAKK